MSYFCTGFPFTFLESTGIIHRVSLELGALQSAPWQEFKDTASGSGVPSLTSCVPCGEPVQIHGAGRGPTLGERERERETALITFSVNKEGGGSFSLCGAAAVNECPPHTKSTDGLTLREVFQKVLFQVPTGNGFPFPPPLFLFPDATDHYKSPRRGQLRRRRAERREGKRGPRRRTDCFYLNNMNGGTQHSGASGTCKQNRSISLVRAGVALD